MAARALGTALACCWLLAACAQTRYEESFLPLSNAANLPEADVTVEIPSLSNCTHPEQTELKLDSTRPVTVIVHGCFSSAGRFRSLADVFAFHGQQAICFNYDDRASLIDSSAQLITAVERLSEVMQNPDIAVIGHSQGGLVARRAFIHDRDDRFDVEDATISLTTISSPFGGIKSAAHCGSTGFAWLTLGLSKPVCWLVTGGKYRDIPPGSEFIEQPGELLPVLTGHLKISTDEVGACRRYNERGSCVDDDFVFSIDEQTQLALENDTGLASVQIKAGHVEIVGDGKSTPTKLIDTLQQHGVLNATPAELSAQLANLLADLYLTD
ncbi:MAG: lysophospholipase [Gammaproteobacteria bacterium]|nr:lysophospholipase [Gammaproteobacteria bacterium]MDH3429615.1 lysophospholipase [Gammaproteobacteria bacterium]MDH3435274.1 lysophospholipase [Gammaproteobacteria bacterium]